MHATTGPRPTHPVLEGRPILIGDEVIINDTSSSTHAFIEMFGEQAVVVGIEYARITDETVVIVDGSAAGIVFTVHDIKGFVSTIDYTKSLPHGSSKV